MKEEYDFTTQSRQEFIEWRWRTYRKALEDRPATAKYYNCSEDDIIIVEPPCDDEIICDLCNVEVTEPIIFIEQNTNYLYCTDCMKEALK